MLKGKVLSDDRSHCVKVGSVTVDITDDIRDLIAQEVARATSALDQLITELREQHADVGDRYNQIARIVLVGGAGMPTG